MTTKMETNRHPLQLKRIVEKNLLRENRIKELEFELQRKDLEISRLQNENKLNIRESCQLRVNRYHMGKTIATITADKNRLEQKCARLECEIHLLKDRQPEHVEIQ